MTRPSNRRTTSLILASTLSALFLIGCSTGRKPDIVLGPSYQPSNVHRAAERFSAEVRRVAVLPVTVSLDAATSAAARETLEPILFQELTKAKRFEVVQVEPARLQQNTGHSSWTAQEQLPAKFFALLRQAYACDAVLFSHVTVFRAYPPLAIGWRFNLVNTNGTVTWWAADEVFDAGQTAVVNGARRYQKEEQRPGPPLDESWGILNSPRRFGHYATSTLLETLPAR